MRLARPLIMFLACALLYGPERIPLDEAGGQWEIKVELCTTYWQQTVSVQTRTYERTQRKDGTYRYRTLDGKGDFTEAQDGWWHEDTSVPLYVTPTAPHGATAPVGEGY